MTEIKLHLDHTGPVHLLSWYTQVQSVIQRYFSLFNRVRNTARMWQEEQPVIYDRRNMCAVRSDHLCDYTSAQANTH